MAGDRRLAVNSENRVIRQIERQDESTAMTVFGYVGDAQPLALARAKTGERTPLQVRVPSGLSLETGQDFNQFSLTIALDAGNTKYLARPYVKRYGVEHRAALNIPVGKVPDR